jgi:tetratricopeptide (TPR) repeat protein
LQEIEGIVISTRTNIVKQLLIVSEITGRSLEGDRGTEKDDIETRAADVALDVEVEKWQLSSNSLATTLTSVQNKRPTSLTWPFHFLPIRNSAYFAREEPLGALVKAMFHGDPPDQSHHLSSNERKIHHIAVMSSESGFGKSELVKEFGHQLLDGTIFKKFGPSSSSSSSQQISSDFIPQVICWISCDDEGAIIASCRELAKSIEGFDPEGGKIRNPLQYSKEELILRINHWLSQLTVPWLLILDNLNNSNLFDTAILPISRHALCGSATVIITTRVVNLAEKWETIMDQKLKSFEQSKTLSSASLTSDGDSALVTESKGWNRPIDVITLSPLTISETWNMCHIIFGKEDGDYGDDGDLSASVDKHDPKLLHQLLQELSEMLCGSPMALFQIFQLCVDISCHRHKLKRHSGRLLSTEPIPTTYIARLKELIHWTSEFHRYTEREFPSPSSTSSLLSASTSSLFFKSTFKVFLTLQNVGYEKCGGRTPALSRAMELLGFLSPSMIDLNLLFYWLRPPSTPILAAIQKKWRLPVVGHQQDPHHSTRLPFQEAEFEISVECIFPITLSTQQGMMRQRFSWRLYRTYDRFREAHDHLKASYSSDMMNFPFPSPNLPHGAPDDILEEAVSQRRAELAAYLSSLTNSMCWGRLCLSQTVRSLLGFDQMTSSGGATFFPPRSWIGCEGNGYCSPVMSHETPVVIEGGGGEGGSGGGTQFLETNLKSIKEDPFFKLIDPLVSVGLLTLSHCQLVTKHTPNIEYLANGGAMPLSSSHSTHSNSSATSPSSPTSPSTSSYFRLYGTVNSAVQDAVRRSLQSNGRYEIVQNEIIQYLLVSFKTSHNKFKKDFSIHKAENVLGRISCEQLLPHVISVVSLASPCRAITEYFDICTLAYHFSSNEGRYQDAVFFATRCIEIITDRSPPSGPGCEQDGLWHGYLADMFFKLSRNEEGRTLYEHSLSILRRTCGQYHRHTLSCLERLGRLLYDMGKYKHSVRVLEEALQISRQIYGKDPSSSTLSSSTSSPSPSSTPSLSSTTNSLLKFAFGNTSLPFSSVSSPHISANSVHIAERINQLVRVMIIDAPDTSIISKCLELKMEELAILRKIRGEYSVPVGRCLNAIGELERKLGHHSTALAYFEDSYDILKKCLSEESHHSSGHGGGPGVGASGSGSGELISPLYNIGIEKHHLKLYSEAIGWYQRALVLKEREMKESLDQSASSVTVAQQSVDAQLGNLHDSLGLVLNDLGVYEESIQHLQRACDIYILLYGPENHEVAMTYNNLGYVWRCMGNLQVSRSLYTRALTTLKKVGTRSDEDTIARTLNALGELWLEARNYHEARVLFMESLSMRVILYGEKHRDTISVMKNLTVLACQQEKWEEANDICTSVLTLQIGLDGSRSVEVAELTGQLAEILRNMNKVEEAKKLYGRSISILKQIYGNQHPAIALQMNNLASALFHVGSYAECEALYEEAKKIFISSYGTEHLSVALCYNNLGELYRKKRGGGTGSLNTSTTAPSSTPTLTASVEKSLRYHQQSLEIRLRLLGAEDPLVASSLYLIADILKDKGNLREAIEIGSQSLAIRIKRYGLEHKEVVEGLRLMGHLMAKSGQTLEAIRYYRDALAAQTSLDATNCPDTPTPLDIPSAPSSSTTVPTIGSLVTADIIESLVPLLDDSSLDEQASLLELCLTIRKHHQSEEHPDVANTLSLFGHICTKKRNYQEAIEFHRIARLIRSKAYGEGHQLSVESMTALAMNLKLMGRLDEARSLFEQCVINTRNHYNEESTPELITPLMNLIEILQLLEQYDNTLLSLGEKLYRLVHRVFGEENIQTADCKHRLGDIYRSLSNPSQAKSWFIQALTSYRKLGKLYSESAILTMEGLIWSLQTLRLHEESEALNLELIEISERVYGQHLSLEHEQPTQGLGTGQALESRKESDAEERGRAGQRQEGEVQGRAYASRQLMSELNVFGTILRSRGKYREASHYFSRALRIGMSLHNGEDTEEVIEPLDGIAWILDAKGLSQEAKPYRERIRKIREKVLETTAKATMATVGVTGGGSGATPGAKNPRSKDAAALLSNLSLLLSEKSE